MNSSVVVQEHLCLCMHEVNQNDVKSLKIDTEKKNNKELKFSYSTE